MTIAIYSIYLLIFIIAFAFAQRQFIIKKNYKQALAVAGLALIAVGHFYATWYKMILHPDFEYQGVMLKLTNLCTSLLIALTYTYVCKRFHIRIFSATAYAIYATTLICFFDSMYLVLDDVSPAVSSLQPHIHIFYKGEELWYWNIYEVPLFFQSFFVAQKIVRVNRKMSREEWKMSKKGFRFLMVLVATMITALVVALIPDNGWNDITKPAYFGSFAIFCTILVTMMGLGYDHFAIINKENEPQYLEVAPKFSNMSERFRKLVEEDRIFLDTQLSLMDVAEKLGTNRTYVSKMVNEAFHETFTSYINRHRLEYAKQYMKENPNAKIETTALECGFGSTSSFNKFFKSMEGVPPTAWNKKIES